MSTIRKCSTYIILFGKKIKSHRFLGPFLCRIKRSCQKYVLKSASYDKHCNSEKLKFKSEEKEVEYCKNNKLQTDILFSIVILLFRTPEKFLDELIDSIQKQTYDNWELILSDGSGNNGLEECLKKYESDKRIKVLVVKSIEHF